MEVKASVQFFIYFNFSFVIIDLSRDCVNI